MALTYSGLVRTTQGNLKFVIFNLTADAAEAEVGQEYHGLSKIAAVASVSKVSGATLNTTWCWQENKDSSGVASAGCIGFSGLVGAASNVVRVAVYGY